MNNEINPNTPIWHLTVGEFTELLKSANPSVSANAEKRKLRGIPGIMEIFKCGRSKASEIRKSGIIDDAITTSGNVFLVDEQKALELMNKRKGGRRY